MKTVEYIVDVEFMAKQNHAALTAYVERARKVLQHEQRTNHQDRAIRPGGMEAFVARWSSDTRAICQNEGLNPEPILRFTQLLGEYSRQDPMQRVASLRAALAILNELDSTKVNASSLPAASASLPLAERAFPQESALQPRVSSAGPPPSARPPAAVQRSSEPKASAIEPPPVSPQPRPSQERPPHPALEQGQSALTLLQTAITAIPGVGHGTETRLKHLGIATIQDLLFYFPRDHRDYSKLLKIADLPFNEVCTTMGLIWEVSSKRTNGGRVLTNAVISDETGKLAVFWFNQPYLQKQLHAAKGTYLVVTGIKQRFGNKVNFSVRSHELPEQGDLLNTGRLVPNYPLTEGLHAKTLRRFTKWVVDHYAAYVPDSLPDTVRRSAQLLSLPDAIAQMHYPENEELRLAARRRLAFDELFLIQLGMQERRTRWQREAPEGNAFFVDAARIFIEPPELPTQQQEREHEHVSAHTTLWSAAGTTGTDKAFEGVLPFRFTPAQRRAIHEILLDLMKSTPMCRLLQGDVGAGKTVVAAAALLVATLNGYQGALMAPTELLAEQHARSLGAMLEPFGIRTVLLTGSLRQRERLLGRGAIERGEAAIAIGTHALIQEDVTFHNLGMVIVDEQHRFGVEQRDALRQKGYHPHMLVMTATPIPRTLALTLYGDLDVSVIDQLPPGRKKIITRWRTGARRKEAYTTIVHQVAEGHQAFIICPLVEESEMIAAKAAVSEYERLQREVFPNLRLGLLHGAMKAAEKDQVMRRFRDHELDVLVATSVIEVGIDVPNATVMVIEDADRFGLSQLHQFRGRVGRGKDQSYCYVLSADASVQAQERLGVFEETEDGFRLAEEDLRLRGPGDFFGVRQSGLPELQVADLSDTAMIELTRVHARKLWESDPFLQKPEHAPLRERMHLFWKNFIAH